MRDIYEDIDEDFYEDKDEDIYENIGNVTQENEVEENTKHNKSVFSCIKCILKKRKLTTIFIFPLVYVRLYLILHLIFDDQKALIIMPLAIVIYLIVGYLTNILVNTCFLQELFTKSCK